ncbi:MAG: cupin domain-containing protein [Chloroflexota bacterium]
MAGARDAASAAGAEPDSPGHAAAHTVSIEIRRFGVGHRRPEGPIGSVGLTGQVIASDGRGTITELAFARGARIEPHTSPNSTWFIVVEGGGWVGVGEAWTRIAAGEAAVWPADVPHAAWTEHSEMRAFVVEFMGPDDREVIAGRAASAADRQEAPVEHAVGQLAPRNARAGSADPTEGEPA